MWGFYVELPNYFSNKCNILVRGRGLTFMVLRCWCASRVLSFVVGWCLHVLVLMRLAPTWRSGEVKELGPLVP